MRYYKQIANGYILAVGTGSGGTGINVDEYNEILSVIYNKPPRTETTDYRLREDLTWEEYQIDPPDPDSETDTTIEDKAEAYDILMGEEN